MRAVAATLISLMFLTGCGPDPAGKDGDGMGAEKMKHDVDAAVVEVVPRLREAFGSGPQTGPGGMFIKCQMGQGWIYHAGFGLVVPGATGAEVEKLATAFTEAGFDRLEVTPDRFSGQRGKVVARAQASTGRGGLVFNVKIEIDCTKLDDADTEIAEKDPGTKYPELG